MQQIIKISFFVKNVVFIAKNWHVWKTSSDTGWTILTMITTYLIYSNRGQIEAYLNKSLISRFYLKNLKYLNFKKIFKIRSLRLENIFNKCERYKCHFKWAWNLNFNYQFACILKSKQRYFEIAWYKPKWMLHLE